MEGGQAWSELLGQVATSFPQRHRTTTWIVGDGDQVFIRSMNAPPRGSVAVSPPGTGQVIAAGTAYDVMFTDMFTDANDDLGRVDAAYPAKYGRYASTVDHLSGIGADASLGCVGTDDSVT